MNTPHETAQGFIRAAVAALNRLKLLGVLTDATIATITNTGTIAKLVALIDAKIVALPLHDADQIRQASLAKADLLRVVTGYGVPIIVDNDVDIARDAGSGNFAALYDPLKALLTRPSDIESAGNQ